MVDVRDVARSHVLALENDAAEGRYLVCNETKTMGEVCDILKSNFPSKTIPTRDMTYDPSIPCMNRVLLIEGLCCWRCVELSRCGIVRSADVW